VLRVIVFLHVYVGCIIVIVVRHFVQDWIVVSALLAHHAHHSSK
jgi:hypothetical protein